MDWAPRPAKHQPMGLKSGDVIFLDTTAIIEAHVLGIWKQLAVGFKLATSGKCLEEVVKGNRPGGGRAMVDIAEIRCEMSVLPVDHKTLVEATIASEGDLSRLHAGESELLTLVHAKEGDWSISSQDLGCLHCGKALGQLDRFVSLEEMAQVAGIRRRILFRDHFTKKWLTTMRTRLRLGTL